MRTSEQRGEEGWSRADEGSRLFVRKMGTRVRLLIKQADLLVAARDDRLRVTHLGRKTFV